MGNKYSKEIKEEAVAKVRAGKTVAEVAREYGADDMSVRNWLAKDANGEKTDALEVSKLKRENEALYKIIGELVYEDKKNKHRETRN
jgi:transposase-like protein